MNNWNKKFWIRPCWLLDENSYSINKTTTKHPVFPAGAYPVIFRGKGFEIFLYARENLGGGLGFFS